MLWPTAINTLMSIDSAVRKILSTRTGPPREAGCKGIWIDTVRCFQTSVPKDRKHLGSVGSMEMVSLGTKYERQILPGSRGPVIHIEPLR